MVTRRAILVVSAGAVLPGCLTTDGASAGPCGDLNPESDIPEDRVTDVIVFNARSENVHVNLTVSGPESRRCDSFDLEPDAERVYPEILEDGLRYELAVEVDDGERVARSWERNNFRNVGMLIEVEGDGVHFQEFQH